MLWPKPKICTRLLARWIKTVGSVFCLGLFCILGGEREIFSCMPNSWAQLTKAMRIFFHTPSIGQLHPGHSWELSFFSSICEISFYSCHKARLIVVVEAKLCCVSSPRGGFRRTPKVPNVNLWNRPIFQQLGFPHKRLWQLSRRRFCPFLLILACWVFHPTRDSDIYTKLSFSFWHINTVFAVVVVH